MLTGKTLKANLFWMGPEKMIFCMERENIRMRVKKRAMKEILSMDILKAKDAKKSEKI